MKPFVFLLTFIPAVLALSRHYSERSVRTTHPIGACHPRNSSSTKCENGPTSRSCWGKYNINTNWYDEFPSTGVIREYWLSVENTTCAPDGYERGCLTFNGTVPGPAIIADWGDTLVIHVTNNLKENGTSIHWHGLRQMGSVEL